MNVIHMPLRTNEALALCINIITGQASSSKEGEVTSQEPCHNIQRFMLYQNVLTCNMGK